MTSGNIYKMSGVIPSTEDLPLRYDLYTPSVNGKDLLPVIFFLHGFKGFKDWGPFPDACEELCRSGFAVIAMNFSLNGVGDDPFSFDRPDLFKRQTLSQDLQDVESMIDAVRNGRISSTRVDLDTDRMGILGHSRGGHTAIVAATEFSEIQCLVTWAAPADYLTRLTVEMINDWEKNGFTEILNSRTGQNMKLGKGFYDDLQRNGDKLIALKRIKELYIPVLFIAGKEDETVPGSDSQILYRNCPSDMKEIRIIPEAGHTFGAAHPFQEKEFPERFVETLELTKGWFLEHLA